MAAACVYEIIPHNMAKHPRKAKTPPPPTPPTQSLGKITVVLTQGNVDLLQRLAYEASGKGGRTISGSAILRALVRYADTQGPAWQRAHLFPLLDEKIASGTVWGTKKEARAESANSGKRPSRTKRPR